MEVKRNSGLFIGDVDVAPASGTIQITENGEHNVAEYATADVDVAQDFTVNESYDISEGKLNGATITLEGDVTAHIPDGVVTVGKGVFRGNPLITTIVMPNSVTTIENAEPWSGGAFQEANNLTTVVLSNSLSYIGSDAFRGCAKLTSINIPNSVTSIGEYAFQGCHITSINIPDGITTINAHTFSGCGYLEEVTIPDSVTSIGNLAFSNCSRLSSIIFPNSVTSIGRYAFQGCHNLTSIIIPISVISIGESAFGDTSLTDIYYTGTQAEWKAITGISGAGIPTGATIHYEYAGDGSEL